MHNKHSLAYLQRRCLFTLHVYTDLAEATCEMMGEFSSVPLSSEDRARLAVRCMQEDAARSEYLKARENLVAFITAKPETRHGVRRGVRHGSAAA